MKTINMLISLIFLFFFLGCSDSESPVEAATGSGDNLPAVSGYPVVSTGQITFYNNFNEISIPASDEKFYGQDAQYKGNEPKYQDNGDGTVTDMVTGLMWSQSPDMDGDGDIDASDKMTYDEAVSNASSYNLGGYNDWRLPTIKELYSLILFNGKDPSGYEGVSTNGLIPFIDTDYFSFEYGDTDSGERIIDAQYASSTKYVATTMNGDETLFGVNFADGRIKGYGLTLFGRSKTFYVAYVRGNSSYGINSFIDNGDSTVTDIATGLMWMKIDSAVSNELGGRAELCRKSGFCGIFRLAASGCKGAAEYR